QEALNIENLNNISDSCWKETYANLGTVVLSYQAIPLNWDMSAGRGEIVLTWQAVEGASGYYVEVYDGNQYSRYDIGDVTTWDSQDAKIYPAESILRSYADNTVEGELLLHGKIGLDLRDNPVNLYLKTIGQSYDNESKYQIRVIPYITIKREQGENDEGLVLEDKLEGLVAPESVVKVQLPNRTDLADPTGISEILYTDNYTAAQITVRMIDNESGPNDIVSYNSGAVLNETRVSGIYMTKVYTVYTNGTYMFTAVDNVGRHTIIKAVVKDINPNKPIIIFNKGGKVISEIHLSKDTENITYNKYGVGTTEAVTPNQTLTTGVVNIKLEDVEKTYYIKLQSGSGTIMTKCFDTKLNGDKIEIIEKY
ncbi:MAG TPA: hypothetical protein DEG71_00085, partial [Clostridiales bacterium]|nr:hypothetical protein [Clostridiales bacterium]